MPKLCLLNSLHHQLKSPLPMVIPIGRPAGPYSRQKNRMPATMPHRGGRSVCLPSNCPPPAWVILPACPPSYQQAAFSVSMGLKFSK